MISLENRLVIAISSRVLFDLEESHEVYRSEGLSAYRDYQIQHEDEPLKPGHAFQFVHKLLDLNKALGEDRVEVILLSRNSADTGLRIFNSIRHHNLHITRAAFSGGKSPYRYATAFGCHLFLSVHAEDVRQALDDGVAAATLLCGAGTNSPQTQLRIAFDGDAVLFSDEAERIYQDGGLKMFQQSEMDKAETPLADGPFRPFLMALHEIQKKCRHLEGDVLPIHTALVTARSAPSHERVIRTLRHWKIHLDESLFLGGLDKTEFLRAFGADIFFDDQMDHCRAASKHLAIGHVPDGVVNQDTA